MMNSDTFSAVCMLNSECGEYIPSLLLHNVIFQSGLRNCSAYVLEWPREKLYWDGWVSRKKPQGISTTSTGFVVEKTNFIGIISGKEIFSMKMIDVKESELPRMPAASHGFQFKTATERTCIFMSKEVNMASPITPLCLIKQLTRCISIFSKCVCLFNSFSILPLLNDAIIILSNLIFKSIILSKKWCGFSFL